MLGLKEFPYLLTLLFGVLGYTAKELSSEILSTTFIEYEYDSGRDKDGDYSSYYITNISKKDSYKDLAFTIRLRGVDTLTKASRISKRPTFHQLGSVLDVQDIEQIGKNYANFEINHLIPGSTYELRVNYRGQLAEEPDLLFHLDRMIAKNEKYNFSTPPVYLRKASVATFLAKNRIETYLILIIIWALLIITYGKKLHNKNFASNSDSPDDQA